MPPLSLLLTSAGLEVAHGVVMLAGAPWDPDEAEDLSAEEIRWFTLCSRTCNGRPTAPVAA